jgi:hypothetical protein
MYKNYTIKEVFYEGFNNMGSSLSISLKPDAPIEYLLEVLNSSPYLKKNKSIRISDNVNEFGKSFKGQGIVIDYNIVTLPELYYMFSYLKLMANTFGTLIKNPFDNKEYPFFKEDSEINILVNKEDYIKNPEKYVNFCTYKGHLFNQEDDEIIDDDYDEDELKYCKFNYIDDESPLANKEFSVISKISDMITGNNEIMLNIYKDLNTFKKHIKDKY